MFRPSALNVETKESENEKNKETKEVQEMQAFGLYNKALQLQRDGDHLNAILVYEQLLKTSLVTYAATTLVDGNGEASEKPLKDPGLILKYSTHKNIASMSAERGNINTAMDHYLKAVMLDTTDVTLWQRIGNLSLQVGRLALASHAFTSGLKCNENHWPCLDAAIMVYYVMLDYHNCLLWISKALEKDPNYLKGLVFMKKIFKECPYLKRDTQDLFENCSFVIHCSLKEEDLAKRQEYLDEAMELREKYRKICVRKPPKNVSLKLEPNKISWLSLGESLLEVYDFVRNTSDQNISFASKVDLKNLETLKNLELNKNDKPQEDQTDTKPILQLEEMSEDSQENTGNPEINSASIKLDFNDNFKDLDGNTVTMVVEDLIQAVVATEDKKSDFDILLEKEIFEVLDSIIDTVSNKIVPKEDPSNFIGEIVEEIISNVFVQHVDQHEEFAVEILENILQQVCEKQNMESLQVSQIKVKKNVKRKINYLDFEDHTKRRSQRVRTSTKYRKNQETVVEPIKILPLVDNFQKIFDLLPEKYKKLKEEGLEDDSVLTPQIEDQSETFKEKKQIKILNKDENLKVLEFIEENMNEKNAIIDFMENYCFALGKRSHELWEKGEKEILVKVFLTMQSHVLFPNLSEVEDRQLGYVNNLAHSLLNCLECQVDLKQNNKLDKLEVDSHETGRCFSYLAEAGITHKIFGDNLMLNWKNYSLRLLWLRSKHLSLSGRNLEAVNDIKTWKEILEQVLPSTDDNLFQINLPNLKNDPIISMKTVKQKLEILERTQTLSEVQNLFDKESYNEVISLLQPTFTTNFKQNTINSGRIKQMKQVVLSYIKVKNFVGLVEVVGLIVPEILFHAKKLLEKKNNLDSNQSKPKKIISLKEWNSTLYFVLQNLDNHITQETLTSLNLPTKTKLIHNIVACVDFVFECFDKGKLKTNTTFLVLVWIILYKLINLDEHQESLSSVVDIYLPISFNLLNQAHEWFADREICCVSEGSLLKFYNKEIKERFGNLKRGVHIRIKEKLENIVQQNFNCLFGYPVKSKTCRIQDHGSKQLTPTWQDCLQMFDFFRPKNLPEFDSFKTSTVSVELSQFILKTIQLVSQQLLSIIPNSETDINLFIESDCTDTSLLKTTNNNKDLQVLADMYYLLADYFFKNNELSKAIKFYLLDIRINPKRCDSWAGMALARSSQTDDQLRLCEVKKSQLNKSFAERVERKGISALSCFKRALSFDSNSVKLWIESGSLAYWLHSVYSRQLKQKIKTKDQPSIEKLSGKKSEMLKLARDSFESVRECDNDEVYEEEWLVDYMCGKIGEKEHLKPQVYLSFYQSAAHILHNRNARYPKKIQSKYGSVCEFAIEALEIYFRVHSSILKQVLKFSGRETGCDKDTINYMRDLVKSMSKSPFALREEKKFVQTSVEVTKANIVTQEPPVPKLVMTSQSSDLTMGSLLPDNILQALNIETMNTDEEVLSTPTESETMSPLLANNEVNNDNNSALVVDNEKIYPNNENNNEVTMSTIVSTSTVSTSSNVPTTTMVTTIDIVQTTMSNNASTTDQQNIDVIPINIRDSKVDEKVEFLDLKPTETTGNEDFNENTNISGLMNQDLKPKDDSSTISGKTGSLKFSEISETNTLLVSPINTVSVIQSTTSTQESTEQDINLVCDEIIDLCEVGFKLCLQRYGQHHKALYRLASLYANYPKKKNLQWAKDLLYGSISPWQQLSHMPSAGLLSDRNKTNIFNGVWRIPMDDIDRPGSFPFHLSRCVELLIQVLKDLKDSQTLLKIHNSLNRTPDHGRKYLRDEDRLQLARRSLVYCRSVLNRKIKDHVTVVSNQPPKISTVSFGLEGNLQINFQLKPAESRTTNDLLEEPTQLRCNQNNLSSNTKSKMSENHENLLNILMECYKVYQETQKHPDSTTTVDQIEDKDDVTNHRLLADAYNKYTCSVLSQSPDENNEGNQELNESQIKSTFEQAVRFCQQQIINKKQNAVNSNPKPTPKPNTEPPHSTEDKQNNEVDTEGDKEKNGLLIDRPPEQSKIQMVEKEGRRYTRIGLPSHSEGGAFKPTKNLRGDPKLRHLMIPPHTTGDSPSTQQQQRARQLIRSTSVPVSYNEGQENKPPHPHRPIFRTGSSVSDYTKLKLKTSILAKTSASLVRKPSITDFEIRQIHGDLDDDNDSDSSQSDDDEVTSLEGVSMEQTRKRKLSEEDFIDKPDPVSPIHAAVITTAGST